MIWQRSSFFQDERVNFNKEKKKFPDNALIYTNQAYLSTVKSGELAIYCHNFILVQLVVAANQLENIEEYACKKNEVMLITYLYDT